jgi:hypothetical protein
VIVAVFLAVAILLVLITVIMGAVFVLMRVFATVMVVAETGILCGVLATVFGWRFLAAAARTDA